MLPSEKRGHPVPLPPTRGENGINASQGRCGNSNTRLEGLMSDGREDVKSPKMQGG